MDEVKADYDQLEQVGVAFANQSEVVEQLLQKVRSSMESLQDGWIGRGSDAFFSEMQSEVLPATERLRQALSEANQVTKTISETMQRAEEEACSPFRSSP